MNLNEIGFLCNASVSLMYIIHTGPRLSMGSSVFIRYVLYLLCPEETPSILRSGIYFYS